ncbi:UDP-N-acetylmuramate dehydrogenase [Pelistega sp. MC2]|uniref:UDP-N-acetylmuramate dehydrogenase n=1 Tax=Pelistega sp. MC2 TaxID=1720297 RepID=UPI0008D9661E|nr:UDP-N-acetylmuramate dehydrogenase [Pelistega sp. MC2]
MFSLTHLNTFGLKADASHFFALANEQQLPELLSLVQQYPHYFILGGGSNVVLSSHIEALIIHNQLKGIRLLQEEESFFLVEAAAGEVWHEFVRYCLEQGWNGLENLAYIPGTVGASPVQNIGAYGKEMKNYFHSLTAINVYTGEQKEFSLAECHFAYRDSVFKHEAKDYLILRVRFAFPKNWKPSLNYADLKNFGGLSEHSSAMDIFNAVVQIRQQKLPDPKVWGNAGSFFKNPIVSSANYQTLLQQFPALVAYPQENGEYKLAAGWLIDQCGWKGRALGAAGVHDRQALVLVNRGGAMAEDILTLAKAIQHDVQERYGVLIEPEPIFVK